MRTGKFGVIPAIFMILVLSLFGVYLAENLQNTQSIQNQNSFSEFAGTTCFQSAQSNVYLIIVNDTIGNPISGASVSGNIEWLCGVEYSSTVFTTAMQSISSFQSNANGVPQLIGSIIGNYSLTLSYKGQMYHVLFSVGAEQNVNVTISLPSLSITESSCLFGGGMCFRTTTGVNQSAFSTTCVVAVPPPQGVYIRFVNDYGSPISGLPITIQSTSTAPCNGSPVELTNSIVHTNSSGWILFHGSYLYYFVFNYSGNSFNFTIPSDPLAWTIATFSVPSGNLTAQICGLGGSNDTSYCQSSQTTVVTPTGKTAGL